jgi:hypothetical protein
MKPAKLGTIFPTMAEIETMDKRSDKINAARLSEGEKELAGKGLARRIVGGEIRYYKTPTIYTLAIKRGGKYRWFETRADGDYSIDQPHAGG